MKRLSIFFFFLSLCLFASCVKEFDDTTVTPGEVGVPKIVVYSNIAGHVMSNDRRQMAGATVQIDDVATTTDMYGNFRLENVPMNGYGQLVKISKEGFFDQYKLVYPEIENNAEIRAILIDKRFIQEFQSDEGGDIVGNKLSINFAPNSIVDSQNQPFQGAVKVFQAPLNPNDKNFDFIVPGNLRSIDENGDDVILQSFAMSVIKLESTDGEPLNIKEGNTAQLTFEIPDTHIDQAPESIPLWYFNEDTGYWIEDGFAEKVGNTYVGDVSHFSFWNCDIPGRAVKISFRLVKTNGAPVSYSIVRLIRPSGLVSAPVLTDVNGYASGLVPAFTPLDLIVYGINENCDESEAIVIGSFSEDTDLEDIVIAGVDHLITVNAKIVDCNGVGIPNAKLTTMTNFYSETIADENGNLSFEANHCDDFDGQYQITDTNTGLSSPIETFEFQSVSGEATLGNLIHCPELTTKMTSAWPIYEASIVSAKLMGEADNGSKILMIHSEDGDNFISYELELKGKDDELRTRVSSTGYDVEIFGVVSGSCQGSGSCTYFELLNGVRGIPGEVLEGRVFMDMTDVNSDPLEFDVEFNIIITE